MEIDKEGNGRKAQREYHNINLLNKFTNNGDFLFGYPENAPNQSKRHKSPKPFATFRL